MTSRRKKTLRPRSRSSPSMSPGFLGQQSAGLLDVHPAREGAGRGGGVYRVGQTPHRPADPGQLGMPALDQLGLHPLCFFGFAGGPGRHRPGPVAAVAPPLAFRGDLRRPLGMNLHHRVGHAGDTPVSQSSRRARVGLDGIPQVHRDPGGRRPADHRRRVQVLPPQGGVGRLPPTLVVEHLNDVRQEQMVVRARIPGPGGGVAGVGEDQPVRLGRHRRHTAPAAHSSGHPVQVGHGGVALGVHNEMHVLDPADHSQLGHALMGRDHHLHARPCRVHQPLPAVGVAGAARPVDRLVLLRRHCAGQPEGFGAGPTPDQRCLAPGRVIAQRLAGMVVAALHDGLAVVLHRLPAHHPHPRHRIHLPDRRSHSCKGTLQSCSKEVGSSGVISAGLGGCKWVVL